MTILQTKLFIPRVSDALVQRRGLLSQLDAIPSKRLTLVSAPAGFGKTTLLAEWVAASGFPTAWLSLDPADNHPARFLQYVIAAIGTLHPGFASDLARILDRSTPPPPEALLPLLVNELAGIQEPFLLVLDDYHLITTEIVHEGVQFVLDHAPETLHLAVGARSDMPVPVSRLRVRGELLELRAADLRFTPEEAADYLATAMDGVLDEEQCRALHKRTEGWVAGLQMAAISLHGRSDAGRFIEEFTGVDRYVLDYLIEEVLNAQPAELHEAILRMSVLERFNAALSDRVTGRADGAELLAWLEKVNLFLVPLDNRREWYRFHHLFADLLRHRLHQQYPGEVAALHAAAGDWLESNGQPIDAVPHVLASGDRTLMQRILVRHWKKLLTLGDRDSVERLFELIGTDAVEASEELALIRAWSMVIPRRYDEMDALVDIVERHLGERQDAAARHTRGELLLLRGLSVLRRGRSREAIPILEASLELLPDVTPSDADIWFASRVLARTYLASAYGGIGELDLAERTYQELLRQARATKEEIDDISALLGLAGIALTRGKLTEAERYLREAQGHEHSPAFIASGAAPGVYASLADLHLERLELDQALACAEAALRLTEPHAPQDLLTSLRLLSYVHQARGERAERDAALARLERVPFPPAVAYLERAVSTALAAAAFADGDTTVVHRWHAQADAADEAMRASGRSLISPNDHLLRARIALRERRPDDALTYIDALEEAAGGRLRFGDVLQCRVIRAAALELQGRRDEASTVFADAVHTAARERYVYPFTLVPGLRPLLDQLDRRRTSGVPAAYLSDLASACGADPASLAGAMPDEATVAVDALTSRELEILKLLELGYTNKRIADKLYLSVNTIKTHLSNLFEKLGATNRVDALVRAREAGVGGKDEG